MSMLITRTPFRISFFGGGTDYPSWYCKEKGAVLATSIDKYCHITCRYLPPFFSNTYRIVWSHVEMVSSISEILHPAVREGLRMMGYSDRRGIELHHQGDLPARAGMGSSSAFANGLLLALSALKGETFDQTALYLKSIDLEQNWLKDNVGSQDQVTTAVGGLNIIHFGNDGKVDIEPLVISNDRLSALNDRLMLFYAGTSRMATDIAGSMIRGLDDHASELRDIYALVFEAAKILRGESDLDGFGRLLHQTWRLKRRLSPAITTSTIDNIYETAQKNGAIGGKLLGAGGTGFMLFYVPPERQPDVIRSLTHLVHVPFRFESDGCVLIRPQSFHEEDAAKAGLRTTTT
ncbi:MAG: kinase [Rhodospirillaceae bacterium]|nr:kinase [Rhodospirillaceae bacterium]